MSTVFSFPVFQQKFAILILVSLECVSKGILNYDLKIGYTLALTVKTIAHGPMFADVRLVAHSNVLENEL